ncbi:Transmembrane protein 63B [Sarcoptes scabiei]|nr:Transmembrane protein 63B [Sarcoptes scabiei]
MELSANNSHYDCNENFIFKTANGSKIEVSKRKIEEIKSLLWNETNDSKNQILEQNRIVNLKKNDDKTEDDLLDFYVDEFYDDLFIISNEDSLEKYENLPERHSKRDFDHSSDSSNGHEVKRLRKS